MKEEKPNDENFRNQGHAVGGADQKPMYENRRSSGCGAKRNYCQEARPHETNPALPSRIALPPSSSNASSPAYEVARQPVFLRLQSPSFHRRLRAKSGMADEEI
jgi:hypothetical protein